MASGAAIASASERCDGGAEEEASGAVDVAYDRVPRDPRDEAEAVHGQRRLGVAITFHVIRPTSALAASAAAPATSWSDEIAGAEAPLRRGAVLRVSVDSAP